MLATGAEALATGGHVGTIPEGNGLVARGLNGVVGYVHAAPRSVEQEADAKAGLLGSGGSHSAGVLGRGANGVVGYTEAQPRDTAWENLEDTGVCGASIGVRGKGDNGGVRGDSDANAGVLGVSTSSSGVDGTSQGSFGIRGASVDGIGVCGVSVGDVGGVFQPKRAGQIWLVPAPAGSLNSPSGVNPMAIAVQDQGPRVLPERVTEAGQLMAIQDNQGTCTLWFCVKAGPPARWAQVLLGPECDGQAP